jgi:hypothetical protein
VSASACEVVVTGSVLRGIRGEGLRLADRSNLRLSDSFLTGTAVGDSHTSAIAAVDSTVSLRFASIVANGGGDGGSLRCDGQSSVEVHSSIVAGIDSPSIDCPGLVDDHSWLDLGPSQATGRGSTNAPLSPASFVELAAGDAHLSGEGASELVGVGQWTLADRLRDVDGDPRVGVQLAHTHPGADRP